jgi:hypothetical protein
MPNCQGAEGLFIKNKLHMLPYNRRKHRTLINVKANKRIRCRPLADEFPSEDDALKKRLACVNILYDLNILSIRLNVARFWCIINLGDHNLQEWERSAIEQFLSMLLNRLELCHKALRHRRRFVSSR